MEHIRNIAVVGHGGSGKTSLSEALQFAGGVTNRLGRVEDGNTITDFEPEEIDRGISLSLGIAPLPWENLKINVIDTPGYAGFLGEAKAALRVADLALFVISAVDGVEVQAEVLWRFAAEEGMARAFFINKLDRERANYGRVLEQLQGMFGTGVAPLQVPIGREHDLRGVVDVIANSARIYDGTDPTGAKADIPDEIRGEVETVRSALVEAVVETDDDLLEAYLDGTEPTPDQLVKAMRAGVVSASTYPVLAGSASKLVGIDLLPPFFRDFAPTPAERPAPPLSDGELDGGVAAYVFKTLSDPYVGRINLFRVFSGSVAIDAELENPAQGVKGRMHNVFFMRGKEHDDASGVETGDIAAVAKLESTRSGDTLRSPDSSVVFEPVAMPRPSMSVAVFPRTAQDEEKLSTALSRIREEDPTLIVERNQETKQTVISGLGDTHLDVTVARIARKFGVEVDTDTPKIPYRETISAMVEAEGKHKKQSGGRGQFGVAFVRFEPLPRGSGYEFVDKVVGGSIPRQLIPAVDKGIQEALDRGIVAGYPVVDLRATVYDGKYHSVDSDEMSFKMAGIMAVRAAGAQLRPVLLEPIMNVTITVPEDFTGDVMGDINSKRGRVLGMDSDGGMRIINTLVPMAEMQRYTIDLRSMTGGRGSFEMEFDHYQEVPQHEAQRVIAAAKEEDD